MLDRHGIHSFGRGFPRMEVPVGLVMELHRGTAGMTAIEYLAFAFCHLMLLSVVLPCDQASHRSRRRVRVSRRWRPAPTVHPTGSRRPRRFLLQGHIRLPLR